MAEFNLGRIRFVWKNEWVASTAYVKDDVVRYGGKTYICVIGHTADSSFYTDLDNVPTRWNLISDGQEWRGDWNTSTLYNDGDIVKYGGYLYICNNSHTSAATATLGLEANQSDWDLFGETLDWKNSWSANTRYKINDIVKYGGITYICNEGHTSAATASLGLEADQSKWDYLHKGIEYLGDWNSSSVRYKINDVVKWGAGLWICTTYHTSSATFAEVNWAQFVEGLEFNDTWNSSAVYQPGDTVTYGGYAYISKTNNTNQTPTTNSDDWDLYTTGFKFQGVWSTPNYYEVGNVVRHGGYTYLCVADHEADSSTNVPPNATYWNRLNSGFDWKGNWADAIPYKLGDTVKFGPNSYVCINTHTSEVAKRPDNDTVGAFWNQIAAGSELSVLTTQGDIVYYGGAGPTRLPIGDDGQVLVVNSSQEPSWKYFGVINRLFYVAPQGVDEPAPVYGVTLDKPWKTVQYALQQIEKGPLYPNARNLLERNRQFIQKEVTAWIAAQIAGAISPFSGSFSYNTAKCERDIGLIIDAVAYDLGHGGNTKTRQAALAYTHEAAAVYSLNQVEETVAAINYANTVIDAVISNVAPGTVYQGTVTRVTDATKVEDDNAQTIINNLITFLTTTITAGDDSTQIIPAEKVNYTLNVKTGVFEEVLPMIIPRDTVVVGDELRSTNIRPASSLIDVTDVPFSLAALTRISSIISNVVQNSSVTPSSGNTETQVTTRPAGSAGAGAAVAALITSAKNYIDYVINSVGSAVPYTGTNYWTTDENYYNAINVLEENKEFLAAEATAYIDVTYSESVTDTTDTTNIITTVDTSWLANDLAIVFSGTTFGGIVAGTTYYVNSIPSGTEFKISETRGGPEFYLTTASGSMIMKPAYDHDACKRDIREYVDATKYDIIYDTNYRTLTAAHLYTTATLGSLEDNMFYVRNGSGLRNCTVQGLTGTLGSVNAYGTKRPSAGAYVSLDPGWGPDDERVWIDSKSCYVQNVTTFGTGCVGLKVDGSLHNGGNDSIVANDFTQVLSDGIGAWVTNLGRAELVSVFSYYGHIGYLAENGGKIRATNGNSSYGDFGCVSEGVDATEIAITGRVNNRATEATIQSVVTDGSDEIYRFEFLNAGTKYSSATYTINGAGSGVSTVANEFRDDGVFQIRLTDPGDSTGTGGVGYITASNNAQAGNTTQITIAATDSSTSSAYQGMRIVITSGTGVGQYGYIDTYNSGSKVATILKDSTGTSGWDHVVPGTPIAVALDVTTAYTIEPRLTLTAPGFTSTARTLSASAAWVDSTYVETADTYTGVSASSGTGTSATFDVSRDGIAYTVAINSAGTGYTKYDTLTIAGTSLGGTSANNITVTVATINDATGAITSIEFEGDATGGVFVAIASTGETAYSTNGTTWTNGGNLPAGTWTAVASGDDVLVAVATSGTLSAVSTDYGVTWTTAGALPASANWSDIAYGNGRWVTVASGSTNAAYSEDDGTTWTAMNTGFSTQNWSSVTYGRGKFVAVATSSQSNAYSTNGTTWTVGTAMPSSTDWTSITYGKNMFVAVATGGTAGAYSLDGITWTAATLPSSSTWNDVSYGQGLFFAVSGSTDAATSEDGITWTARTMSTAANGFSSIMFGNPSSYGIWVAVQAGTADTVASSVRTGATAQARCYVSDELITEIRIVEPGSGYNAAPTLTIVDPNNTTEAATQVRVGTGVLATPTFNNRGTGYVTATATVVGDGYADYFQTGQYISVKGLTNIPRAGSNVQIAGIDGIVYKLVNVLSLLGSNPYTASLQLSPAVAAAESPDHNSDVTIRIRYSQVRLTGHDFLDIGTGNFASTNYPNLPFQDPIPANETVESGGGRVFYTSTDQDGNFRVGDIFSVEQSTGTATLNADAFNLAGLQELQLGAVALGGSGATITEFSTDPFFTADSDSIIPTQRAIKAYISSQIGSGSSSLNVNTLTAGIIFVSGDTIETTTGAQIQINAKMYFKKGVDGYPLALSMFS